MLNTERLQQVSLPDVVQDDKFKGEMKIYIGNGPKIDVKNVKPLERVRRSLPAQSCQLPSQQVTGNISNDESVIRPPCKSSYSMSEYEKSKEVYRLQKESLSTFDPLLGAILEPYRKVQYSVLPTSNSAPNLKKKISVNSVPGLDLTSYDTNPQHHHDSASFDAVPEQKMSANFGTEPKQKHSANVDTEPEDQQHSSINKSMNMMTFTPKSDINKEIEMTISSAPNLKKKISVNSVPGLDLTSFDTNPQEQHDCASFDTVPEQNISANSGTEPKQKHSASVDTEPEGQQHSSINESMNMMAFTPRSDINKEIEMTISSYKWGNKKSEEYEMKVSKEKMLVSQQVLILKERIALQQNNIFAMENKEYILQENIRNQSKIERTFSDEYDKLDQQLQKQRLELVKMEEQIQKLNEEKRKQEEDYLLSLITLEEDKEELSSQLTNYEKNFSVLLNAFETNKALQLKYMGREGNLKEVIAEKKRILEQSKTKYDTLEKYVETEIISAKNQIEAENKRNMDEYCRQEALLKKTDLKIHSLESALRMKIQENLGVTNILNSLANVPNETLRVEEQMVGGGEALL